MGRDKTEITADCLRLLLGAPRLKTKLVYDVFLNDYMASKYLRRLIDAGLVTKFYKSTKRAKKDFGAMYEITRKGVAWMQKYEELCNISTVSDMREKYLRRRGKNG